MALILILSITLGHFFSPVGILAIPLVIPLITWLIIYTDNGFNVLVKSVLCYVLIGLNDIGIRLYAGGIHDSEGNGLIVFMMFIGLIPAFIILLIGVIKSPVGSNWIKVISVLLFILLIIIHLKIFGWLGTVR